MANATVAQNANRETIAAALRQARIEAAEHRAWFNAINKAALNLGACKWAFDGDTLQIESATSSGKYYIVRSSGCPCKAGEAGKPCWHRAARRLLIKAAEMAQPAIAEPELPESFLDGDFDAFEDASLTAPALAPVGVTYKGEYLSPEHLARAAEARKARTIPADVQQLADELFV